jgi:hypothetical protein
MENMRNAYNIFAVKPECKRLLGRSGRRWEDNIRKTSGEIVERCGLDSSGSG